MNDRQIEIPADCIWGFFEVPGDYSPAIKVSGTVRVLDIGANVGAFSIFAAYKWPGCIVHSYEPDPKNFKYLSRNCDGWSFPHNQAVGLGDTATLYFGRNGLCGSTFAEPEGSTGSVEVECLDASLLPEADIVKIDCEGAEWPILYTSQRLHQVDAIFGEYLMVEYHSEEARNAIDSILSGRMALIFLKSAERGLGIAHYAKT